jgi:hypothetical protein
LLLMATVYHVPPAEFNSFTYLRISKW